MSETEREDYEIGGTFLEVGKSYLFRTVTMIYTGKIKVMVKEEIVLEKAAWIADTGRWADAVKDPDKFSEVEPYPGYVILFRGAMLDIAEIDESKLPTKQK